MLPVKSCVVIGLGRFGEAMAKKLFECGEEVLAIDVNERIVDRIADHVTRAVVADARDIQILDKLGVGSYDQAVVAMGEDLAASAQITMNLKDLGVPYIMCKAFDTSHQKILEKLGANRVIIPEQDMAFRLALGITNMNVMECIDLSDEFGIVEMKPLDSWVGKSIRALDLRSRCKINVIAVRNGQQIHVPPDIDKPLNSDTVLFVLGSYDAIEELKR